MVLNTSLEILCDSGTNGQFFKICKIVFLGGSIIEHGGQNPLEAARYGCKIIYGPNIWNFREIYALLDKYNFSIKTANLNQMLNNVDKLFKDQINSNKIKNRIKDLGNNILNLTLKEVNFFVNKK